MPTTAQSQALTQHAFAYVTSDIPAGMTIREFRAANAVRSNGPFARLRRARRATGRTLRFA
jgi:hypothetical protein